MEERSLVDTCISSIAQHMPRSFYSRRYPVPVPPELVRLIYNEYIRLARARRLSSSWNSAAHLECMRQLATYWQPSVLALDLPQIPGTAFAELSWVSSDLVHLSLACAATSQLSGLSSLTALCCLSLRGCGQLQEAALQQVLTGLTQLHAVDLCGLSAVDDRLAPVLASLQQLQVLNINRTQCTDVTVDWLTYGHRLQHWQLAAQQQHQQQQQQLVKGLEQTAQLQQQQQQQQAVAMQQWPRCKIKQWHVARTRVTARTAELLSYLPELTFVDMRGSGVTASQLVQLRAKFNLKAPQGAVLTSSAAMAVAAVSLDAFVCAAPLKHSKLAAGGVHSPASSSSSSSGEDQQQQWVHDGISELIRARAEVDEGLQQAAASLAPAAVVDLQVPAWPWLLQPPGYMCHSHHSHPYSTGGNPAPPHSNYEHSTN